MPLVLNKGIFTAKVPLLPGENSVIAQAFDQAGNSSQTALRMNLDTTAEAAYTRGVSIGGGIGGIISRTTQDAQRTTHYYLYDGQGNVTVK